MSILSQFVISLANPEVEFRKGGNVDTDAARDCQVIGFFPVSFAMPRSPGRELLVWQGPSPVLSRWRCGRGQLENWRSAVLASPQVFPLPTSSGSNPAHSPAS